MNVRAAEQGSQQRREPSPSRLCSRVAPLARGTPSFSLAVGKRGGVHEELAVSNKSDVRNWTTEPCQRTWLALTRDRSAVHGSIVILSESSTACLFGCAHW